MASDGSGKENHGKLNDVPDDDEPDAQSFSLKERRVTDPDEVAYWLEVLKPLHRHESDRAKYTIA